MPVDEASILDLYMTLSLAALDKYPASRVYQIFVMFIEKLPSLNET